MKRNFLIFIVLFWLSSTSPGLAAAASFAEFEKKAQSGEKLNVIFFGSSLSWGANATDPQLTSYRALISAKLEQNYPKARFKFWDACMGGTNSQLAVFRLDRDVLCRKPDLVFLDFSANDDMATDTPETLASYESLIRRIISDGNAPVVLAILPFEWNATAKPETLKRRLAHLILAKAYNTGVGDAVALCQERIQNGKIKVADLWPFDRVHPGDAGYAQFADAVWQGLEDAIKRELVCSCPKEMINGNTYMTYSRAKVLDLPQFPEGWQRGKPMRTSPNFDQLMSRWLDDVLIGSNRKVVPDGMGKVTSIPQKVDKLNFQFRGSMVMLLGESTEKSCKYKVFLNGKLVERDGGKQGKLTEFDASWLAYLLRGNSHLVQVIGEGLDPKANHTLEIEPIFSAKMVEQELRLESICVAGGDAKVLNLSEKK